MQGDRDSEICVMTMGENTVQTTMGGQPYTVDTFAHELRGNFKFKNKVLNNNIKTTVALWKEHLGLHEDETFMTVEDPLSIQAQQLWQATSFRNTEAFQQVFPVVPGDNVTCFHRVSNVGPPQHMVMQTLSTIKGTLISYPLDFLRDESLDPSFRDMDVLLTDTDIFT